MSKKVSKKKKTAPKIKKAPAKKMSGKKTVPVKKALLSVAPKVKIDPKLRKVRMELVEEKSKIISEIMQMQEDTLKKSSKDSSGDLSSYSYHMADMASDFYDREFLLSLAEGERERLLALDDAIRRIDDGTYGKCDTCGCRIPKERLKVMPQTQNCISCQEKQEKGMRR